MGEGCKCPEYHITCLEEEEPSGDSSGGSKISPGAAAGAALGGLAGLLLIFFLLFRIWAKRQRTRSSLAGTAAEKENDFGMLRSARASTHTVASIASTVRTRASNIIQIAYVPGVTSRSNPPTPTHLAPPVPNIPYAYSPQASEFSPAPGDIRFGPDDLGLRNSMVTVDNRSSVATTIYGGGAVVSQPNVVRAGKAAVVQVRGGSSNNSSQSSPNPNVPPVPALGDARFSVGSTFFSRVESRGQQQQKQQETSQSEWRESVANTGFRGPGERSRASACESCITDMDAGSPFGDENSVLEGMRSEALEPRRLSAVNVGGLTDARGNRSPFGDENEIGRRQR